MAGRVRVRGRQNGQARGLRVRTGKGQNQEDRKKRDWGKPEAEKLLVDLNKQDKLAHADRKRRYKYPGDKWGRWATPVRGVETSTRTGETDQGVTC